MLAYYDYPPKPLDQPAYLTIGSFDGLHLGHRTLITEMLRAAHANGCTGGLLTFDPHQLQVLRPDLPFARLTSVEERSELLAALGLDFMLVLPFTRETAATSAGDFMHGLVRHIPLRALWIGPDFALGRGREGNAARLAALGQELGYRVEAMSPFNLNGELIRSSRVRALLSEEGTVDQVARLLGRPYVVWGTVVHGAHRGRSLGFPTANVLLSPDRVMPAFGVYACWAWRKATEVGGTIRGYPAVINVGIRPSFDGGAPSVEAFLREFDGDLYGEMLGLSFIQRLRGERRFSDITALIAQIRSDASEAGRILAGPPDHTGQDLSVAGFAAPKGTGSSTGQPWEDLPHTADWAIRIRGDSQRQLFARAASAMFRLQEADASRPVTLARAVNLGADSQEELMVRWLNALLLAQELGGEIYTRFEIHEISPKGLRGTAYGYHGTPAHTAIKAVTYYDLEVIETAGGWSATITFDV